MAGLPDDGVAGGAGSTAREASFARACSGASAIEYGLKAALVSCAIMASLQLVGCQLSNTFRTVAGAFPASIRGN